MAATCPKCRTELPRQLLWKALKSGTLDKAEITCPQCEQVLRVTPGSLATILALAILAMCPLPDVAHNPLAHLFPGPSANRNRHPGCPGSDPLGADLRPADCLLLEAGPVSTKAPKLLHQGLTDAAPPPRQDGGNAIDSALES